jgi:hypothetical protein
MKPNIIGKSILLRDVEVEDAEFIHKLRCDEKNLNIYQQQGMI